MFSDPVEKVALEKAHEPHLVKITFTSKSYQEATTTVPREEAIAWIQRWLQQV